MDSHDGSYVVHKGPTDLEIRACVYAYERGRLGADDFEQGFSELKRFRRVTVRCKKTERKPRSIVSIATA